MTMPNLMRSAAVFGLVALLTPIVRAQDYSELSLEQLLQTVVTSASKKSESVAEAPSIVEVITAEDIRKLGANNLRDVFDRATSVQVIGSTMTPENVIAIRGQDFQHENNHVLVLINGRPLRESTAQGLVASVLAGFPLDLVDAVEIIRGPGSVLYGSSAFSGVVNIKTKSLGDLDQGSLSFSQGSYNTLRLDGYVAQGSQDWSMIVGARYLDSDGWDMAFTDFLGTSDTFKTEDEDLGATVVANYKNFSLNGFYGRTQQNALQPSGLYPVRRSDNTNGMVDLGYQHRVGGGWMTRYNVTYNHFDMGDVAISSDDFLGEVTLEGSVGEDLRLLFGTTYEDQNVAFSENELAFQQALKDSKQLFSVYGQADYQASDWLKLVGGFQYNKPQDLSGRVSPRLGIIGNFENGWGFKLLYGEAFRTPTFVERSIIGPPIIFGNPNLLPEEIATSEAQVSRRRSRYQIALTYYHSKMTNLIERVGFPIEFINNTGETTFDGLELEGRVLLAKGLELSGNVAYQENENDLGVKGTTLTPDLMAKLGFSYDAGKGYSLGLYDSYFGEPTQVHELVPLVPEVNAPAKAYHLVTLNATLDMGRFVGSGALAGWKLQIFVDNLLDEDIYYPDLNGLHVNSVPIRPGRGVFAAIKVDF